MNRREAKKPLTEAELLKLAERFGEVSDDDYELSDSEEDMPNLDDISSIALQEFVEPSTSTYDINELPIIFDFENDNVEYIHHEGADKENMPVDVPEKEEVEDSFDIVSCKKIIWKKKEHIFDSENIIYKGNSSLPHNLMEQPSPYSYFRYFFDDELFDKIIEQSNLYSVQTNPNKPANITKNCLKKYLGICIHTSLIHMPNMRDYWSERYGIDKIRNVMSVNRFEKIRQFIHFNDNSKMLPKSDENHDRLYKLRPIIDSLQTKFLSVPFEECSSVDEQICATKARHFMKQYMPMKPHKWGFKLFVLSGVSGFAYNFEIYSGQENSAKNRLANEPDLGSSANVVVRLCRQIPKCCNYKIYFDNYYTSISLMAYLHTQGILSLGTIRRNRLGSCKFPDEKSFKKRPRGSSEEYVARVGNRYFKCHVVGQ